jgi:Kef-type K+ transport system membrane component KefB
MSTVVISELLITLGGILLLGLMTDLLGRRTFLPRVTLLLIFGVLIGRQGLDLIPTVFTDYFEIIADTALLMVGFLLGGKLTGDFLRQSARQAIWISITAAAGTTVIVTAGLIVMAIPVPVAIILGCIAASTAPAATVDLVMESNSSGNFGNLLLAIVALDDAWGLALFSMGIAIVAAMNGGQDGITTLLLMPAQEMIKEIGGAIVLGAVLGFPSAYLTGRIKPGQPMLTEALGIVFLCGGLALWLEVSFLIASMVMGVVVVNFAKHHEYTFEAIEGVEWPVMAIFFILAGASLELAALKTLGYIGISYILLRIFGKIAGAWMGGRCSGASNVTQRWMGVAMLPQAGVAIGMALVASNRFPEYRQTILSVVIGSTIFFEVIGPVFARLSLSRAAKFRDGG